MSDYTLQQFVDECRQVTAVHTEPDIIVRHLCPSMKKLMQGRREFLEPHHFQSSSEHYQRNAIFIADDGALSLFALVWLPGQWTPVHDHGSWGVVGVLEGTLEERSYLSVDGHILRDENIHLRPGGCIMLDAGSVTSFVPEPDHIHIAGVPESGERVVSLHLYGRNMDSFHIYDVEHGERKLVDVAHE